MGVTMINLATLPSTPANNQLGAYLRRLWDATRATGQTHGVWRPDLGRFVTLDELRELEKQP
jgi:hypothetical protein